MGLSTFSSTPQYTAQVFVKNNMTELFLQIQVLSGTHQQPYRDDGQGIIDTVRVC